MLRNLLIQLSNNSNMTNEIAMILEKLEPSEQRKIALWVNHAKNLHQLEVQRAKRKLF
jgi:hypothetical protein